MRNLCRQSERGDGILHFFHINNVNLSAMEPGRPGIFSSPPAAQAGGEQSGDGQGGVTHKQGCFWFPMGRYRTNWWQLIVSKLESTQEKDSQWAKFFTLWEKGVLHKWKKFTEKYSYCFLLPGSLESIATVSAIKKLPCRRIGGAYLKKKIIINFLMNKLGFLDEISPGKVSTCPWEASRAEVSWQQGLLKGHGAPIGHLATFAFPWAKPHAPPKKTNAKARQTFILSPALVFCLLCVPGHAQTPELWGKAHVSSLSPTSFSLVLSRGDSPGLAMGIPAMSPLCRLLSFAPYCHPTNEPSSRKKRNKLKKKN